MEIKIDQSDLQEAKAMLIGIKNGYARALNASINKSLSGVQTDAVQEIYNDINLTKTRIRKDFKIYKSSFGTLSGKINSAGKHVGLATFTGTKQVKKGVSVKVKRRGKRITFPHAFIEKVGNTKHVFLRKYKGPRKAYDPRKKRAYGAMPSEYRYPGYPPKPKLKRLTGPRIQDFYDKPQTMDVVLSKGGERFKKNINHEVDRVLQRLK